DVCSSDLNHPLGFGHKMGKPRKSAFRVGQICHWPPGECFFATEQGTQCQGAYSHGSFGQKPSSVHLMFTFLKVFVGRPVDVMVVAHGYLLVIAAAELIMALATTASAAT